MEQHEPSDDIPFVEKAYSGAALIAMRDGTPQHRKENREWAESVFAGVLQRELDFGGRMRTGMLYNPVAIAFAGRVFAMDGSADDVMIRRLLEMAAGDAAAAHGARGAAVALRALDERIPQALLRVAFAACLQPRHSWDTPDDVKASSDGERQTRLQRAIQLEIEWLKSRGEEPPWPLFPEDNVLNRKRRFIQIGASREIEEDQSRVPPDVLIDHQAAALWLESLWCPDIVADCVWLRDVCSNYAAWTFTANGAKLSENEEVTQAPLEWNHVFFAAMANCIPVLGFEEVERAIAPIVSLPERNFFDVTKVFLREFDGVFFNQTSIDEHVAMMVRSRFAARLGQSDGWRRLRGSGSDGIEMLLGPAAAVLFFNDAGIMQAPKCYLFENAALRSMAFIPILQDLASAAPSPFVAIILFNWIEVAPRIEQLPIVLGFSAAALDAYPDSRVFWNDHGIGNRACKWLQTMLSEHVEVFAADAAFRPELDRILASLVAIGVAQAAHLEKSLPQRR